MIFNEALYPAFLAIAVAVFFALPKTLRPWWLFLSGAAFYGYYAPEFVPLLLAETVAVFLLARYARRSWVPFLAGVVLTVGILGYFKYSPMFARTAGAVSPWLARGLPSFRSIYLPLAISFFTFEFVHYIVESRRGNLPEHGFKEFGAFAMFFPTMVAGPIKRFEHFVPQLAEAKPRGEDFSAGITRLLSGAFKKIVLADTLALWVAPLATRDGIAGATGFELAVALLAFSLKIYFDFSGYSDIAIGSARMFGVHVPENFAWPYLRTNISEFWRHWHMSLTRWITDYVYIPLGGSRAIFPIVAFNTLVAMGVSGLWHGAAWHFVAWGLFHGALLVAYRGYSQYLRPPVAGIVRALPSAVRTPIAWTRPLRSLAGGVLTFALVTLGWGLFLMPLRRYLFLLQRLVDIKGWF